MATTSLFGVSNSLIVDSYIVNVKAYPYLATGNGVNNDAAAIVAADTVGQLVFVPEGTYLINSNTTLNAHYRFDVGAVFVIPTGVTLLFTSPANESWAAPKQIFRCTGTGKVQWLNCSPEVFPDWWSTNTTPGSTNVGAAIQAAFDCVVNGVDSYCPSKTSGGAGRCDVNFVTGKYYAGTTVLDCNQRDWMTIRGTGRSEIISDSTTYVCDRSSTFQVNWYNLNITSYTAGVGFLFNRCTSNPYCLYNVTENTHILIGTNPTKNGGQGSIGFVNSRAEQNVWNNVDIRADQYYLISQNPQGSFPPVSGTQDNVIISCVVGTYNSCNFLRHTKHNFGGVLDQIIGHKFNNCYWATVSTASGTNPYANFMDTCSGVDMTGVMEGTERFIFMSKTSSNCKFIFVPQVIALDTGGIFNFDSANNTGATNCLFDAAITSAVAGGKVIRWSGSGPSLQFFGNVVRTGQSALIEAVSIVDVNVSAFGVDVFTDENAVPQVTAAATLVLLPGTRTVIVNGNTGITSISALGFLGKTVKFIFTGTPTVTDGSNLRLAGNFVCTADDSLTLTCTGVNWFEDSRSVN